MCTICASSDLKDTVVDLLMSRTLGEIDSMADSLDEILITLPGCLHVFTVETLDGVCGMDGVFGIEFVVCGCEVEVPR